VCLLIGFFIRLIPELLVYSSPIGFDPIWDGFRAIAYVDEEFSL
jgi:hypothetical protein